MNNYAQNWIRLGSLALASSKRSSTLGLRSCGRRSGSYQIILVACSTGRTLQVCCICFEKSRPKYYIRSSQYILGHACHGNSRE